MCNLIIDRETASAYVDQAVAMARTSMDAWCAELQGLGLTGLQDNMIAAALTCRDDCRVGELMRMYLGARLAESAKDRAREELIEKYGKEVVA